MILPALTGATSTGELWCVQAHVGHVVAITFWQTDGAIQNTTLHVFGDDPTRSLARFELAAA